MLSLGFKNIITQVIERTISIEEFEDWYVPRLSFLLRDPDSDDADVIAFIELVLAEINAGIVNESDALKRIAGFAQKYDTIMTTWTSPTDTIIEVTTSHSDKHTPSIELYSIGSRFSWSLVDQLRPVNT